MPVVHGFVVGQSIGLERENTEMFFNPFNRSAERNAMRVVMQMGTTTIHARIRIIRNDNVSGIEAGAFHRANHIITKDCFAKAKHLVQVRLGSSIHVEDSRCIREQLREQILQGLDHFGDRAILQKAACILFPGIQRELDANFINLFSKSFFRRNCTRRKRHIFGFRSGGHRIGFIHRNPGRHSQLRILDGIKRFIKVFFGNVELTLAHIIEHQAKNSAPCPDKNELATNGNRRLRHKECDDDTCDKRN